MRKNVIALMLVLPLLFVFVVFSTVSAVSMNVVISASGIEIKGKPANDTKRVDLAIYEDDYELEVEVQPANASNKEYRYVVEAVGDTEKSGEEIVTVDENNRVHAHTVGTARISAVSLDGAYRDSITFVVASSVPYDFNFSLYEEENEDGTALNLVEKNEEGVYTQKYGAFCTGTEYHYGVEVLPSGYTNANFVPAQGYEDTIVVNQATSTVMFPFAGETQFDVVIPNGIHGKPVSRRVSVNVDPMATDSFLLNGVSADSSEPLEYRLGVLKKNEADAANYEKEVNLYLQTENGVKQEDISVEARVPVATATLSDSIAPLADQSVATATVQQLKDGCFKIVLKFANTIANPDVSVDVTLHNSSGEAVTKTVKYNFMEFEFSLRTQAGGGSEEGSGKITSAQLLLNTPISYYVVPTVETSDVHYLWEITTPAGKLLTEEEYGDIVQLEPNEDGTVCTVKATAYSTFIVRARAAYPVLNGEETEYVPYVSLLPQTVSMTVIRRVTGIQFLDTADSTKAANSLGGRLTIAGYRYQGANIVPNEYEFEALAYDVSEVISGISDLEFRSSDKNIATVRTKDGKVLITPCGTGVVDIIAEWTGNDTFGSNVSVKMRFDVAATAVLVKTSPQLYDATKKNNAIVLGSDIMLGTSDMGNVLSMEERSNLMGKMTSTYNTEFYRLTGNAVPTLNYALEFTNNVYGNGYTVNAEHIAAATDSTGMPRLFKGPLKFVSLGDMASVAAQDNISFLCRTDNVSLYNVNLLGCNDSSLYDDNGNYDLNNLNTIGTTLEINANVNVVNCRVRNGRNVVRAYGGNRSGSRYMIESLGVLDPDRGVEAERIKVNVEGCIISQGREFLLKMGTNRALRSNSANSVEPNLLDASGKPYTFQNNDHLNDEYFYKMYVMTDLTLKDSVLETSGLFTVGIESNFAGSFLHDGEENSDLRFEGWAGTGGTSFASILRLVGDVRLYDWKDISLVNSDTLIEGDYLKLDIAAMLKYVCSAKPNEYGNIIQNVDGKDYVHGGIACYGGGKNYSIVDMTEFDRGRAFNDPYYVNINVLKEAGGDAGHLGEVLPLAAGTQDFRFFMYGNDNVNDYYKQVADTAQGIKYNGINAVRIFEK